jgi:hypothetical protein
LARRRSHQAEQHPQCGRLAGAVGPQEAVDLAAADAQVQVVDGDDRVVVALGQPARLDDELAAGYGGVLAPAGARLSCG